MHLACLDVEGVLVPEIWQNVALRTGVEELQLTTRDVPDYHELMQRRLGILDEHGITLADIQAAIATMEPLPGAAAFIDRLRQTMPFILLSDTFEEFAAPLMKQLGYPTLFCNSLGVAPDGRITTYRLRQENGKFHAVTALHSIGYTVYAAGDSYNDLAMIREADRGAFFTPPPSIVKENPDLPVCSDYAELYAFLTA
ncbi:MAG: bifunctional phosphoserine phosphatase/homoserine phosphotransferase ThrH [Spirochaeta sp.]|jgi:phosphoserine/homoserine phosphotransferase|nr:bifunctional phosphoserine phosphatase/homoserine phosphotransferase ThrH [Spirochaeta sp.]